MTTRINTSQESSPERKLAPDTFSIPLGWRIGLSALLLLHLLAVFLPPFQFACRVGNGSSSPFADGLVGWFRPYIGALYLDHGYFFFAPNPGPSHLVKYKVEFADGERAPIEGRFPDLQQQQPRLKYHRHFMIAEAYNNQYTSPVAPPEPSPPPLNTQQTERQRRLHADRVLAHEAQLSEWKFRRRQYEELQKSLTQHLLKAHGGDAEVGDKVTITRVEHRLLSPFEAGELRMKPSDPTTYVDLLEAPPASPSGVNR
ncbi:hypothetical protein ETAA8_68770 [Anatilimnocola aggregata]|uniref:Uncharacterized protein n=1 Tax=Anatilimnocola aggregata TaxID=2528021 RepID=A0A517YNB9_9BACT|nr:hypothetical protein [Anatilimnocola aggregata]QDU31717.1 hypothetical protein ETAA8_68770 [Anatilimnocola aggregata]